ncbi:hypothetical protein VNO77_16154 [Canavalia gladiata]|uniref:Uncharacterized protein n=1 Tax=Canavalia gladiata TaxID=3824 RepID=A0AAN9M3M2_CANGL
MLFIITSSFLLHFYDVFVVLSGHIYLILLLAISHFFSFIFCLFVIYEWNLLFVKHVNVVCCLSEVTLPLEYYFSISPSAFKVSTDKPENFIVIN